MGLSRAQGRGHPLGLVSAQARLGAEPCSACRAFICSSLCSGRAARGYRLCLSPEQAPCPPAEGPCVPPCRATRGAEVEGSPPSRLEQPGFSFPWDFLTRALGMAVANRAPSAPESSQAWLCPAPKLGALKPPCSRSQQCSGDTKELFPMVLNCSHSQSWCIPNQGAPLMLPCTLRPMLPPVSLLQLHPWPLSPSSLGLEFSSPPFPRPPALQDHPSHLHFSFPVPPELQVDLQLHLSPPDITQPRTVLGQELALLLTPDPAASFVLFPSTPCPG